MKMQQNCYSQVVKNFDVKLNHFPSFMTALEEQLCHMGMLEVGAICMIPTGIQVTQINTVADYGSVSLQQIQDHVGMFAAVNRCNTQNSQMLMGI